MELEFNELLKSIVSGDLEINLYDESHVKFIKYAYSSNKKLIEMYEKMYEYYKGNTDAMENYKFLTERSNLKINVNFIKKFIKEEVSYTIGNPITYESRSNNSNLINDIEYYTCHWDEMHDSDLMKYLLIFTRVYELYYINNKDLCSKIIKPTEGYAYMDVFGKVLFFIHEFKNDFDTTKYIDVYTKDFIYHLDGSFNVIKEPTRHIFGEVPVSVGNLTLESHEDSLYKDIKGLQDAFETNLSDIANEISDFRNAYLKFTGCSIDETKLPQMKELGVMQVKDSKASIDWLIKNINDTFIQNTLDRYEDTMYQIACHINHNEKLQSNLSGITLRSRLIALENKCELEEKAHKNMIKSRLKFLCKYLNLKNKNYDHRDIKIIYTPNIPQDDIGTAQMLSQLPPNIISNDTARGLFSFINNKVVEEGKVKKEIKDNLSIDDDYSSTFNKGSGVVDE